MAKMQAAAQGGPVVDEAAMEEMRRLIFEAPIAELAESQGISIDEAVSPAFTASTSFTYS